MGTFAGLFEHGDKGISDDKVKEFEERVEVVYQNGGMMDIEPLQLCGKKVITIRKARMKPNGMDFFYNYFEDTRWENAGFNKKRNCVWSNKIGWSHFHRAVVAAYVLEEQYTENVAVAMVDGEPVTAWGYVGWLNYLFDETKHVKNYDTWKLFEAMYYLDDEYNTWDDWNKWNDFGTKRYAFISSCEIYAVLYGVDEAIKKFEAVEKGDIEQIAFRGMKIATKFLKQFAREMQNNNEKQCQELLNSIKKYYTKKENENMPDICEEKYETLFVCLDASDAPAFVVKGISELFQKDFKELWNEVKDVVRRKQEGLYGNEGYYVEPISTEKFFRQSPDDLIYYWKEDDKLEFSDELWEWFKYLRNEYDILLNTESIVEHPLHYMVDLMEEADDNYYNIFAFSEFVEECIENLNDRRYQVLWRLYDNMIHNPELMKAGDVIFVPEGPGHEKEGLHYWGEEPKRRLKSNWDFINPSEKNNKGRVTLKRYMALVANKFLREKVFGF